MVYSCRRMFCFAPPPPTFINLDAFSYSIRLRVISARFCDLFRRGLHAPRRICLDFVHLLTQCKRIWL